ncbi:MAG: hypothetical protein HY721_22615 [Planctomycetes bacterium]|nr:hypothetical protein [Planctomycetota bacterium]
MLITALQVAVLRVDTVLAAWLSQASPAAGPDDKAGGMVLAPVATPRPDFQPYIFWAYGLACLLLFLFSLWAALEARRLQGRLEGLKERFRRAHPGVLEEDAP